MSWKLSAMLLVCLLVFCGNDKPAEITVNDLESHKITDLNAFYLEQLKDHHFLLLGEGRHHNDRVMNKAVINLLNEWLSLVEKKENVPAKVTLVLEYPQSFGEQLYEFFKDNNVSHFGLEIQGRKLSTLEFFYDLKSMHQRFTEIKKKVNVDFEIFCPEQNIPFDLSREEHSRIARTERDNNTTITILEYIQNNPEHKIIAYYGYGHIARRDMKEPITPWGIQIKEKGIDTYAVAFVGFDLTPLPLPFEGIQTDFVLTDLLLEKIIPHYKATVDAHAFYKKPFIESVVFKDIPSVLIVKKAAKYARQSEKMISALTSLWFRFTGQDISARQDIVRYVETNLHKINAVAAIDDLSLFKNMLFAFNHRNMARQDIDRAMFDITCFKNVLNRRKRIPMIPDETAEQLWMRMIKEYELEIKTHLYTSLLFYGTPGEKRLAEKKLAELTGKDFQLPGEWLEYSFQLWESI